MTGGTRGGTGGISGWLQGGRWRAPYAVAFCLMLLAGAVNVTTALHDTARPLPVWEPVVWESSSLAGAMAALWVIFAAADRVAGAQIGWVRIAGVHAAAACVFSALHCGCMWLLRHAVYVSAGASHGWQVTPSQALYEFRKDVVTYAVVTLVYRGMRRMQAAAFDADLGQAAMPPEPARAGPMPISPLPISPVPTMFDIRDGARLHRVRTQEILVLGAAGNYVEFVLDGGARVLMRGTLADTLAALAPAGFVRVHRSWAVNAARVRRVDVEKSGDYRVTLDGGVEAPLSRRFRDALGELRLRALSHPPSRQEAGQ